MASIINVRNVPPAVHKALKARAQSLGMSLSALMLQVLTESLERPTDAEFRAGIARLGRVRTKTKTVRKR